MVIWMTKIKVIGTPNIELLESTVKQIAYEIYVLQPSNENMKGEELYEAIWFG